MRRFDTVDTNIPLARDATRDGGVGRPRFSRRLVEQNNQAIICRAFLRLLMFSQRDFAPQVA